MKLPATTGQDSCAVEMSPSNLVRLDCECASFVRVGGGRKRRG